MSAPNGQRARVIVLISGGGSNLQRLIDAHFAPDCAFEIVAVISNRPDAGGLQRAINNDIPAIGLDHKAFADRVAFDQELAHQINLFAHDFVVCAGFMRILTPEFVSQFEGRLINIHPSLLPSFRGVNTHARALEAGVAFTGCSVHWVSAGVDEGAVIGQAIVPVLAGDSAETLAARVLVQEHRLYPICVALVASKRAYLQAGQNWIDGQPKAVAMLPDGSVI